MDNNYCIHGLDKERLTSKSGCSGSWHLAIANKQVCRECGKKTRFIPLEQWEKEAVPIIT
jgi:hypothetical protein